MRNPTYAITRSPERTVAAWAVERQYTRPGRGRNAAPSYAGSLCWREVGALPRLRHGYQAAPQRQLVHFGKCLIQQGSEEMLREAKGFSLRAAELLFPFHELGELLLLAVLDVRHG